MSAEVIKTTTDTTGEGKHFMTPLQVEILTHYHRRWDDYRDGDFSSPWVRAAIEALKKLGLLEDSPAPKPVGAPPQIYRETDRGYQVARRLIDGSDPNFLGVPTTPRPQSVEAEITPGMIAAGAEVVAEAVGGCDLGGHFSAETLAKRVYLAMTSSKP